MNEQLARKTIFVFQCWARRFIVALRGASGDSNRDVYGHAWTCVFRTSSSSRRRLILSNLAEIIRGSFLNPQKTIQLQKGAIRTLSIFGTNKLHSIMDSQMPDRVTTVGQFNLMPFIDHTSLPNFVLYDRVNDSSPMSHTTPTLAH